MSFFSAVKSVFSDPAKPDIPDYAGLAEKQAASDRANVNLQTKQNRPNIVTGEGTQTWTTGPNGRPVLTSQLNPTLAGAQASEQGTRAGIWGAAQGMVPGATAGVSQPWNPTGAGVTGIPDSGPGADQQTIDATYQLMIPELLRQRKAEENKVITQGGAGGQELYGRAQYDLGRNENDARLKSILAGQQEYGNVFGRGMQAHRQGMEDYTMGRMQPIKELGGLMGLGGHINSNFDVPTFNRAERIAPTQYLPAGNQQYGAEMGQYNADQANNAMWIEGLMGLGKSFVGGGIPKPPV